MLAVPPSNHDDRLRRRLSRGLAAGSVAIVVVLVLFGLAASEGTGGSGGPAPAFDLPLIDGGRVTHTDLAGRVAVINVWASWCGPCREEAPVLARAYRDADPARVVFLGVTRNDQVDDSRDFIARFGVLFPSAIGDGAFASAYGVRGVPMTYIVAPDGTLVARHFGPINESRLRALIADALSRPPAASASGPGA